jgi:phage shock protein A
MFDSLKAAIHDLLHGNVAPGDRRAAIAEMKRALVSAKLGVEDVREGVEQTGRKLAAEREQLATVQRRKALAEGISDAETVALAVKYEQQHAERIAVLERKLGAQEAEASLAERELGEMMTQLKSANAGVGSGAPPGEGPSDADLGLPDDAALHAELDGLVRQRARSEADAAADARLAELKRKMGQ